MSRAAPREASYAMIYAGLLEYAAILPETAISSLRQVFRQVDVDHSTFLILGALLVIGVYFAFKR